MRVYYNRCMIPWKFGNFVVCTNPKAGCTVVIESWLRQFNLLDYVTENFEWIHLYREEHMRKYHRVDDQHLLLDNTLVKILYMRNPVDRMVSSYLHWCKFPEILQNWDGTEYTFRQFVHKLYNKLISLNDGQDHWCVQASPHVNKYIKIEDIDNMTRDVNDEYGLNLQVNTHYHHHINPTSREFPMRDISRDVVWQMIVDRNIPQYKCFYDDNINQQVESIYHQDIVVYNNIR